MGVNPWRVIVAFCLYGTVLIWGGEWIFALATSRDFAMGQEVGPRWTRAILVALPFAGFALYMLAKGKMRAAVIRQALVSGMVASGLLWGWYFLDPIFNQGGGANIGLGIILLASPLLIFLVMWGACRWRD